MDKSLVFVCVVLVLPVMVLPSIYTVEGVTVYYPPGGGKEWIDNCSIIVDGLGEVGKSRPDGTFHIELPTNQVYTLIFSKDFDDGRELKTVQTLNLTTNYWLDEVPLERELVSP